MEGQDGISICPMRLKVLYTFDDKTNCLARWPQLLDIQTAYLDEGTKIGVIELKTCIQAIVSASPELVAKLGRDYTVYAYDYSEYETPLVGQGMLSWVLASASPTPNAPAHQSKTIVTGRVCKNALGLFSRGAQETLEVKLRLVPVPTALQSEYLSSMQKYRDLSDVIPHDFDAQAWTNFLQANPGVLTNNNSQQQQQHQPQQQQAQQLSEHDVSDRSGIEKLHQLLSESSTPRDFSNLTAENFQADSPYATNAPSRTSTPGVSRPQQKRGSNEAFRPSSRGSVHSANVDSGSQPDHCPVRRDSVASGYGSADEGPEGPAQKRAKLVRQTSAEKPNTNIERQAGSLRVAASTAASVRIHRPTPLYPSLQPQASNEDPVRPPTPIPTGPPSRRSRAQPESRLRRESTSNSQFSQLGEQMVTDENLMTATSPEDIRGGNPVDTPFNMPSSPPVMDNMYPQTSSPGLPPMPDHDSGFMSGGPLDSMMDDPNCNHDEKTNSTRMMQAQSSAAQKQLPPSAQGLPPLQPGAPNSGAYSQQQQQVPMSDNFVDCATTEGAPSLPPQPKKLTGSRPSSRASVRRASKPLAPAPVSQRESEAEQQARATMAPALPASEPAQPTQSAPARSQSVDVPMSELASTTPAPTRPDESKPRSGGAGLRRSRQVQARLDQCIKEGSVPPYCENCGAIDTTTWRRAWSKVIDGDAEIANSYSNDPGMLYWEVAESDEQDQVTSFKLFKKSLANEDKDFTQLLLCNPCGLWLHKCKTMRPENKWNKPAPKDKKKRKSGRVRIPDPQGAATRSRTKTTAGKVTASSPGGTEASSPTGDDESTPAPEKSNDDSKEGESQDQNAGIRRAASAGPPNSAQKRQGLLEDNAVDALKRAIQSSPARNMEARKANVSETSLTPKPVRRALFSSSKDEDAMRTLSDAFINGMRRSPKSSPKRNNAPPSEKENNPPTTNDGLDELFDTGDTHNTDMAFPSSPTPKRRSPRRQPNTSNENEPPGSPSPTAVGQRGSPRGSQVSNSVGKDLKTSPSTQISHNDGFTLSMFDCEDGSGPQNNSSLSVDDEYLRSLFENNTQPAEGFEEILDSELFDPALVDPQIFDMWAKDPSNGAPGNEGIGEVDDSVFSAIMQEVNGRASE